MLQRAKDYMITERLPCESHKYEREHLCTLRNQQSLRLFTNSMLLWLLDSIVIVQGICLLLNYQFSLTFSSFPWTPAKCFTLLSCTTEPLKLFKYSSSRTQSSVENLSVNENSSKCLANQRMLPVLAGTRDPEMCSISSWKLQRWIINVNHEIHISMWFRSNNLLQGITH